MAPTRVTGAGWGLLCAPNPGFPKAGPVSRMVPALSKRASAGHSKQLPAPLSPAGQKEAAACVSERSGGSGPTCLWARGCHGAVTTHSEEGHLGQVSPVPSV